MEVPLMLSLVKLGLRTRKYFPRKKRILGRQEARSNGA
jgi:ACR3 family arsenite efflux pump ArsB